MSTPQELLSLNPQLTTLPAVYHKLSEAINSPRCTTGIISRIISHDPTLTLKVLKLVNSAFYGFPHEIDDIPQAILIIGLHQLNDLVLANSIIDLFKENEAHNFSIEDFWHHSLATGLLARILSSHSLEKPSERIFIAGLLHAIGKLIMNKAAPEKFSECIELSSSKSIPMINAEIEVFGYSHCDINNELMRQWNIPLPIREIATSYKLAEPKTFQKECQLIAYADTITECLNIGSVGSPLIPAPPLNCEENLCITPFLLEESIIMLRTQQHEVFSTFLH